MEDFMKIVEAYRWKGEAVSSLSPAQRQDDTGLASSFSCVRQCYGSKMESQDDRLITGSQIKASNSSFSDHGSSFQGRRHGACQKPHDPSQYASFRQLVFSSKGVCANLDVERSKTENDHVKKEKKARKKVQKSSGRNSCHKQGGISPLGLPDFLDDSAFEDKHSTKEGFPNVVTESQQPPCKLAKKSASKKRRGTPTNGVVSIKGKSPFFSPQGTLCDTSCVNGLMPITPTSNTEKLIHNHARKRKKGSIQQSDISAREVDGAKQPSASQHASDPIDVKAVDDQLVYTTDRAIVSADKNVSSKASRKAKRSIYFEMPARPLGQRDIANTWIPPVSVHALIQEELYQDPWKVLVACMLLNKTAGTQMRKVIWDLFALCPTPEVAVAMETEKIEDVIKHLGLQRKRARMLQKFSRDYLGKEWTNVGQLHGIGKYATDAYAIFCEGRWREVKPDDHKLVDYWEYLCVTEGVGYAFKDDREKGLAAAASPLDV